MGTLTKAQESVLALLCDVHGGEAGEQYIKDMAAVGRGSITSLWRRDMVSRRDVTNGIVWTITPAGRAALSPPPGRAMSTVDLPPPGTLTDRVTLERRTGDGLVPIATVWGRIRSLPGPRDDTVTHGVLVRFRSDLVVGDRINYRGRRLDIISSTDINGRCRYLQCLCREIQAAP